MPDNKQVPQKGVLLDREILKGIMKVVDAKIELALEREFGRDTSHEHNVLYRVEDDLAAFFSAEPKKKKVLSDAEKATAVFAAARLTVGDCMARGRIVGASAFADLVRNASAEDIARFYDHILKQERTPE